MSRKEGREILYRACDRAVVDGVREAIAAFDVEVEEPVATWTVAEASGVAHLPCRRLRVGHCIYARDIPRNVARKRVLDYAALHAFSAPIVYTSVSARGRDSAVVLARERFIESASILDLIDLPKATGDRVSLVRRDDGVGGFTWSRGGWVIDVPRVDEQGRLADPYRRLALALRRAEDRRSDWERRVLAACRWFSKGWRTNWPADRLVSLMVALECLFVPGRQEGNKGARIAEELTERFRVPDYTESAQVDWIRDLYRARNDAVHEGREFLNQQHVELLVYLAQAAIRHAAAHLVPAHRPQHRSCRTYSMAMKCPHW